MVAELDRRSGAVPYAKHESSLGITATLVGQMRSGLGITTNSGISILPYCFLFAFMTDVLRLPKKERPNLLSSGQLFRQENRPERI